MQIKYLAVIAVCMLLGGYLVQDFMTKNRPSPSFEPVRQQEKVVVVEDAEIDWFSVQEAAGAAVSEAKAIAIQAGKDELDEWHKYRMRAIEEDFLDWYFGWWRTQKSSFSAAWTSMTDGKKAAEREMFESTQRELEARGLSRRDIDRGVTLAAETTGTVFAKELKKRFENVRSEFSIPTTDWIEFLEEVSLRPASNDQTQAEGLSGDLTAKGLYAGGGAVGVKAVAGMAAKAAASKAAAGAAAAAASGLTGKAAIAAAGKAGGLAAAKTGSAAGGPIVFAVVAGGLSVFEWWSHSSYVEEEKPKLRKSIDESLQTFKDNLMRTDGAIGEVMEEIELQIHGDINDNIAVLKN